MSQSWYWKHGKLSSFPISLAVTESEIGGRADTFVIRVGERTVTAISCNNQASWPCPMPEQHKRDSPVSHHVDEPAPVWEHVIPFLNTYRFGISMHGRELLSSCCHSLVWGRCYSKPLSHMNMTAISEPTSCNTQHSRPCNSTEQHDAINHVSTGMGDPALKL